MTNPTPRSLRALALCGSTLLTILAAWSVPAPVRADDTEVFFPTQQISTTGSGANPNIMFFIDTSGSMSATDGFPTLPDGTSQTRLKRVQMAFSDLMDTMPANVNVGLMRFSGSQGGAVMFPVAPIDATVASLDTSGGNQISAFTTVVPAGSSTPANRLNEADQVVTVGTGAGAQILNSVRYAGGPASAYSIRLGTDASRILVPLDVKDEAEQWTAESGLVDTTKSTSGGTSGSADERCSNDLDLSSDSNSYKCQNKTKAPGDLQIGLRFPKAFLPKKGSVLNSSLTVTDTGNSSTNNPKIKVQALAPQNTTDGIDAFVATNNNVSSRGVTSTTVNWDLPNDTNPGVAFSSPLLTTLVSESLADADWAASKVLGLKITNTSGSSRSVYGVYSGVSGACASGTSTAAGTCGTPFNLRPKLAVTFGQGTASGFDSYTPNKLQTAVRFENVSIPKGVTVQSASIEFHNAETIDTRDLRLEIKVDNVGNSASLDDSSTGADFNRTTLTGSVLWDVPDRSKRGESISTGTPKTGYANAGDITSLINGIVNRSDWCGGNALTVVLKHNSGEGAFNAVSSALDPSLAPVLRIAVAPTDPALNTGCNKGSTVLQVKNKLDDAAETPGGSSPGTMAMTASALNLGCKSTSSGCPTSGVGSNSQYIAVRFNSVPILQGATVEEASLEFTASGNTTGTASFLIRGESVGDSAPLSSNNLNISTRRSSATTASVTWNSSSTPALGNWSDGVVYRSPELKTIVQEIVNRGDWQSFNDMTFIIEGSGRRSAYSIDGKSSAAPRLRLKLSGGLGPVTVRQYLKQVANGFIHDGNTPSVGGIYEAARYFRGEDAYYGRTRGFGARYDNEGTTAADHMNVSSRLAYAITSASSYTVPGIGGTGSATGNYESDGHFYPTGCSDFNLNSEACSQESWTGTTTYKSPINNGCQSNNLVFLSDGEPNQLTTSDGQTTAKARVEAMIGKTCASYKDADGITQSQWSCAPDLADYMNRIDQIPDSGTATAARPVLAGAQNVHTYTIAFGPDVAAGANPSTGAQFLSLVAQKGGGQFFTANDTTELTAAFNTIVGNILDINTTFVAPAVTVNTFNRLTNRNELYFAVFKPNSSTYWPGNLKRYQLFQKSTDASVRIYDNTPSGSGGPLPAVDDNTGFFKDTDPKPISFWSPAADGGAVDRGGVASKIDQSTRKVYTYVSTTAPSEVALSTSINYQVHENNTLLTNAVMGVTGTATDLANLLKWARGVDVLDVDGDGSVTDSRLQMGDPLHSEPQLITYGGTDASPDITIYVADNVGGLHAVNAADGTEYFSFLPQELLPNYNAFMQDDGSYTARPKGLDGGITAWINDTNKNGKLVVDSGAGKFTPETGDFAYLYVGMRRGGRNYYALDVSNRSAPKLKFQISGGTGNYIELGQTWSKPIHAKIRHNKVDREVLIFTGGYDPNVDTQSGTAIQTTDTMGRALFVADATDGSLIWWAGYDDTSRTVHPNLSVPLMQYAVPASPRVIDLDNDGLVDRIYIADMGGQVFRFVLGKDSTDTGTGKDKLSLSNTTVNRIAHLAGTASNGSDARRFYATPDAALITTGTPTPFISIALGSGYREHPLTQNTEDRFYVLRDPDISNSALTTFDYTESDLYDATTNDIALTCAVGDTACTAKKSAATTALGTASTAGTKKGFYIKLADVTTGALTGEKVLTESITFGNQILFATFQPGVTTGICSAVQGLSRLYQISVLDGTPTQPLSSPAGTPKPSLVRADRRRDLKQGGLPPNPTLLFPAINSYIGTDGTRTVCTGSQCLPNQALLCVGAECLESGLTIQTIKTFWQKVEN